MTRAGHAHARCALRALWPRALAPSPCSAARATTVATATWSRAWRARWDCGRRVSHSAIPVQLTGDARRAYEDFVASGGRCEPWSPRVARRRRDRRCDLYGTGLAREVTGDAAPADRRRQRLAPADRRRGYSLRPARRHGAVLGTCGARRTHRDLHRPQARAATSAQGPDALRADRVRRLDVPAASLSPGRSPRRDCSTDDDGAARAAAPAAHGAQGRPRPRAGDRRRPRHAGRGATRGRGRAARSGAGLVTLAVHPENTGVVARGPSSCASAPRRRDDLEGCARARDGRRRRAGPRAGRLGRSLLEAALASGQPLVVDADALNLLPHGASCR